jgi:hypothetical protein
VRARYEFDGKAWQFHVPHWHKRAAAQSPTQMAQSSSVAQSARQ